MWQWQRDSDSSCRGISVATTASPHVRRVYVQALSAGAHHNAFELAHAPRSGTKSTGNVECFFRALPTQATWVGREKGAAQRRLFTVFTVRVQKISTNKGPQPSWRGSPSVGLAVVAWRVAVLMTAAQCSCAGSQRLHARCRCHVCACPPLSICWDRLSANEAGQLVFCSCSGKLQGKKF